MKKILFTFILFLLFACQKDLKDYSYLELAKMYTEGKISRIDYYIVIKEKNKENYHKMYQTLKNIEMLLNNPNLSDSDRVNIQQDIIITKKNMEIFKDTL